MTIEVLEPHGPCNGVKTAVAKAMGLRDVYYLHEPVHNEIVVNRLKERGHHFVSSLDEIPPGATLVISAHGTSPAVKDAAAARGLKTVDLTCPYVGRAHNVAREAAARGLDVLVLGDRDHVEVKGILGELAAVGGTALDFESAMAGTGPIAVVSQTTLDIELVDRLRDRLAERREIVVYSPPCAATRERQEAVRRFCREGGRAVLVLGSRKSANTLRLVAIAAECGASAFRAATIDEVCALRGELRGLARLGVTAGASTPDEFVEESCRVLSAERIHGRASENAAANHALQMPGGTRSRASVSRASLPV